jgi:hypothetical protein
MGVQIRHGLAIASAGVGWMVVASAHATALPSTTDLFENASVLSSDSFQNSGPSQLFDGDPNPENFYYSDKSRVSTDTFTTTFQTAAPVTVAGVNIFIAADDGAHGDRAVGSFDFQYFDVSTSSFVDLGTITNPTGNFSPQNLTFAGGPVTAQEFRAISTPTPSNYYGPRLLEIDAVAPEPASLGLLGIGSLGLLSRRRRI